jgi:hypothetical protein
MSLQQEFRPTDALSLNKLKYEIASVIESLTPEDMTQLDEPGLVPASDVPTISDYDCKQNAGIAAETIILTFASKVAYDVWKQIVLPKLKARYGGAAMSPVTSLRKTKGTTTGRG